MFQLAPVTTRAQPPMILLPRRFFRRAAALFAFATAMSLAAPGPPMRAARAADPQSPTLDQLVSGKLGIVDLTYPLNERTHYWPGENYEPFRLKSNATLEKNIVSSKAFCIPEHMGTHIDAPNHFERNRRSVDQIAPTDLM